MEDGINATSPSAPFDVASFSVITYDYCMIWHARGAGFVDASTDGPHPVIRIFGWAGDATGKRVCANVHGVYPYFYFRPESVTDPVFSSAVSIARFDNFRYCYGDHGSYVLHCRCLESFEAKLENMLSKSRVRKYQKKQLKRIHCLEVVSKLPVYGYYPEPEYFVKVCLRFPEDTPFLVKLLEVRSCCS
jgi:hypothetical protein